MIVEAQFCAMLPTKSKRKISHRPNHAVPHFIYYIIKCTLCMYCCSHTIQSKCVKRKYINDVTECAIAILLALVWPQSQTVIIIIVVVDVVVVVVAVVAVPLAEQNINIQIRPYFVVHVCVMCTCVYVYQSLD